MSMPDPDEIIEQGEEVFTVAWDSGGPGAGADVERVYRFGGAYYACPSYDSPFGPFSSLAEALKASELDLVTEATTEVTCHELDARQVAALLRSGERPGLRVQINGDAWVLTEDGRFSPAG